MAGVASRRLAEEWIRAGRIRVDGRVATRLGTRVDPETARVQVDGRPVRPQRRQVYLAYHKPRGQLCAAADAQGRPTVLDTVRTEARLLIAGRLDKDSEGLLLLSSDGEWAQRVMHPRYGVPKLYRVDVKGRFGRGDVRRLLQGMRSEGEHLRAQRAVVVRQSPESSRLVLELNEGRKREIRRMMEHLGYKVRRLKRVGVGPVKLAGLKPGCWRPLTRHEIAALQVGRS